MMIYPLICFALLIQCLANLLDNEISYFDKCKLAIQNLTFCGINQRFTTFNDGIRSMEQFPTSFEDAINSIFTSRLASIERNWLTFHYKIKFFAAFLNNPQSVLCRNLLDNKSSYLSYLKEKILQNESELNTKVKRFDTGTYLFYELFTNPALMNEIKLEFKTDAYLCTLQFPSPYHPLIVSDLFGICSFNETVEFDSFSMIEKVWQRIDEFEPLISHFLTTVKPTSESILVKLCQILSIPNIKVNQLHHLLLFSTDSPIATWMLENLTDFVAINDKDKLIDAYLDFIFDKKIYTFIFKTVANFNSVEKLHMMRDSLFRTIYVSEMSMKSLLLTCFILKMERITAVDSLLAASSLSRINMNAIDLEYKIASIFGIVPLQSNEIYTYIAQITFLCCYSDWIQIRLNEQPSLKKDGTETESLSCKISDNAFTSTDKLSIFNSFCRTLLGDFAEESVELLRDRIIRNLLIVSLNKNLDLPNYKFLTESELKAFRKFHTETCGNIIKTLISQKRNEKKETVSVNSN